jgi:3-dehydrosphinganine reductase
MKIKARIEPGSIAMVTGGSSGIGKAIACKLAARGMHVWIWARRENILKAAISEIEASRQNQEQKFGFISADLCDLDQVKEVVNQVSEQIGIPDILINSAGVVRPGYVQDLEIEYFHWMMNINYFGTVNITKQFLPGMIKRGSGYIVNISSGAGYISYFGYTAYGASKFAVRGFTEALRQEMKPYGIGVSIVYPPDTDTPQLRFENRYKPYETKAISGAGGLMTPSAVADIVLKGISRGHYSILPGLQSQLYFRANGISEGLVHFIMDQILADARKKHKSSS